LCDVTDAVMFELPHTIQAPAEGRNLVAGHACPEHAQAAVGAAQVVVSELGTCAVLYGKPPIVLGLDCAVTRLRIAVTHRAAGSLVREIPVDEDGGLRSALLTRLATSWGIERGPESRTLWSSLPTGAIPEQSRGRPRTRIL